MQTGSYSNPWKDDQPRTKRPLPDSAFSQRQQEDRRFIIGFAGFLIAVVAIGVLGTIAGMFALYAALEFLAKGGF